MTDALKAHCAELRSELFNQGFLPQWLDVYKNQVTLTLPFAAKPEAERLVNEDAFLRTFSWTIHQAIESLPRSAGEGKPAAAKNVIAVVSGKGGVGKSSVCVNLALALAATGAKVGILDADIYGPSIPTMLGNPGTKLTFTNERKMVPLQVYGLQATSLGYLVDEGDATVWRGPMASGALQQLYNDTLWHDLDYLLVDMPPGTGDIQLTLAQKLPLTGAMIVTTPQTVALNDAQKGIAMLHKVKVPVLGVLENMSAYQCSACGHTDTVFGENGGARVANQESVPLLGQWPLVKALRESMDAGKPLVYDQPDNSLSQVILDSAQNLTMNAWQLLSPHAAD